MNNPFINEVLDPERVALLPLLGTFKDEFYLAGGTALAMQLGHRKSIDFDFFTEKEIDSKELTDKIHEVFINQKVVINQEAKNTLGIEINNGIKVSFMTYGYPLLNPVINTDYLNLASIEDIACMKFGAIVSRSTLKDYSDLYFILHKIPLNNLLEICKSKLPSLNQNLILKSLTYFNDISEAEIVYTSGNEISIKEIENYLIQITKEQA